MTFKTCAASVLFFSLLSSASVYAAEHAQNIAIDNDVEIPGDVLKPGIYTLVLKDVLPDRVVVDIAGEPGGKHRVLLAVANEELAADAGRGIVLFPAADGKKQILRAWVCPTCTKGLEFVYSKADAVKITAETAQSVLAFDARYDKMPATLSTSDLKRTTLWQLSPAHVKAERGIGVKAVKWNSTHTIHSDGAEMALAHIKVLPKTATNTPALVLCGGLLMITAFTVRATRLRRI